MKSLLLLFLVLASSLTFAQTAPDTSGLSAFLNLDRFEAYTKAWAATMRGRGKEQLATAVQNLTPTEISAMNLNAAKLADAKNYDDLILDILKKKHPEMAVTKADVEWGYNFFKSKMNEGYIVKDVRTPREREPAPRPLQNRAINPLDPGPLDSSEVLLDVDGYASDRTTRAVFWEASDAGRKIELFPGPASAFQDEMTRRGAKVIAEVGTKARNYNPIYLIQNPGETGFHYAITEISGADRLKHFELQISLVRWQRPGKPLAPPAPVSVVGNAASVLLEEERALTNVLKTVPRADHIVIGQKGALERTFGSLGKIQALLASNATDPAALAKVLTANELKVVTRALGARDTLPEFVMKYASDIDKIYEKAVPTLISQKLEAKPFTVFNYDRGTYEMSDYILRGADGKEQRWRIFSNVWGDEVLPIAKALKASGYNSVNYVGTAGAFQGTDLKVGDLVVPRHAATLDGTLTTIQRQSSILPDGAKAVNAVVNVQSPFEETRAWFGMAAKTSQVVEVETGYLASVFNSKKDNLNVQLLISDVVGSEHETLATAQSSSRRKAQIEALSTILDDADVVSTAMVPEPTDPMLRWVQELFPTRDLASQVQLIRTAVTEGITTKEQFEEFARKEKSFTTARAESTLRGADSRLAKILARLREKSINPIIAFGKTLFDGRFNPSQSVDVAIVTDPKNVPEVNKILTDEVARDRSFKKLLEVTVASDLPSEHRVVGFASEQLPTLKNVYRDGMLYYGGLSFTENASGAMKFVRVTDTSKRLLSNESLGTITTSARCAITNYGSILDDLIK